MLLCCESVFTLRALANPSFSFLGTGYPLVCCNRGAAQVLIAQLARRTPARPVLENAHLFSILILAHVQVQASLDFTVNLVQVSPLVLGDAVVC